MLVRTTVTLANVALVAVAIALQLIYPVLGVYLFVGLLGWFFISIVLARLPAMNRPLGHATGASGVRSESTPLFGDSLGSGLAGLGFCPFCGTDLPAGSVLCRSCGHRLAFRPLAQ